jgi:hypothetical protein
MKTKIVSLLLALGLITNVALASNSASIGYTSDFFYRGEQKAKESVQSKIDLSSEVLSLQAFLHACTNQSVDTGSDSYNLSASLGKSFSDGLVSLYGGFSHYEDVPGNALSEVFIRASSNVLLNPSVSIFRDIDDELFTYEVSLGHSLDLGVASLGVDAAAGSTDLSSSSERTYYGIGANLSKQFGGSLAALSVDYIDADDIDREFVFGTSLTFKF